MRKFLLSVLFVIASILAQGQSVSFQDTSLSESGSSTLDDIIVHCWFYNNSGKTNLKWIRVQNNIPNQWESAVCDNVQCYGSDVDSANFSMNNNDSFNFSFHFYPNSIRGVGNMKVCVYAVDDPLIKTCGTFSIVGWGAGMENILSTMEVFPNPASNVVNFKGGYQGLRTARIIDLAGKVISEKSLTGTSNQINVEDIPNGCYMLSLESFTGLIHQKIFVQH